MLRGILLAIGVVCLALAEWYGPRFAYFRKSPRGIYEGARKKQLSWRLRVLILVAIVCFCASVGVH